MELIEKIIKEIELRKKGSYGDLSNLSDIELYALAYTLGIKING